MSAHAYAGLLTDREARTQDIGGRYLALWQALALRNLDQRGWVDGWAVMADLGALAGTLLAQAGAGADGGPAGLAVWRRVFTALEARGLDAERVGDPLAEAQPVAILAGGTLDPIMATALEIAIDRGGDDQALLDYIAWQAGSYAATLGRGPADARRALAVFASTYRGALANWH